MKLLINSNKYRFRVVVNYKYNQGHYKEISYWFDNEEQYNTWHSKEISNEKIRKIIDLKREDR